MENNIDVDINENALKRLEKKIIALENMNLRTKNKTDSQMVSSIIKMIEEEDRCYYNQ